MSPLLQIRKLYGVAGRNRTAPAASSAKRRLRRCHRLALAAVALPGVFWLALSGEPASAATEPASTAQPAPTEVVVATVAQKEVTQSLTFTGRVEAIDKVDLRARVDGYLEKRVFTEGQMVNKGDLLYQIEQAQYKAKVDIARADVARAQANAVNTGLQLRRGQELLKNNNIPASVVDERAAADAIARAEVQQQQAALRETEINLGYTQIYAPFAGQVGRSSYSEGNYVAPSSGTLAPLVSRDPMYATFPVTQREILALRKKAEETGLERSAIKVHLQLADGSVYPEAGTINFLNVQVSQTTDTLTVRATIPNPKALLIDGQLVVVTADLGQPQMALFVPQQAVQFDQGGYFVLAVDDEQRVKVRRIGLGQGRGTDLEVTSGLKEGERVITEGLQKVRPNQVVQAVAASQQQQQARPQ